MHIILTGATGSVGAPALRHILASPKVSLVSILSRRQFELPKGEGIDETKAQIIVHNDFSDYPEALLERLRGAEGCIWAQGVSQNDVNKEQYVRITYDYPLAAAKAFAQLSPGVFKFVYVSGEGADPTEKTLTLFGKIKGRAEKDLLALPASSPSFASLRAFNVRPGYVDPPNPDRPRSATSKVLVDCVVAPALRTLLPGQVTPVDVLAKVLTDLATGNGNALAEGPGIEAGGRTVRSSAIRRLAAA